MQQTYATHALSSRARFRARLTRPVQTLLLAALPLLGGAGCTVNEASAKGELRQSVADATSIVVTTRNGNVDLIHDPAAASLEIVASIRCAGSTEEKAAARVKDTKLLATRAEDGTVRVSVDFPPADPEGGAVFIGVVGAPNDAASIVVRAANLVGVTVATTNGNIDVGAFSGLAKLTSSNGSIEITNHAGAIEARSSNGTIRASGVLSPIDAKTSNGRIEVTLAPAAQGDISLETSNGSVTLDLGEEWQGKVTADTSNGKIELSGGEVSGKASRKSMAVGDSAKAKAEIETSNGRVTVRSARK